METLVDRTGSSPRQGGEGKRGCPNLLCNSRYVTWGWVGGWVNWNGHGWPQLPPHSPALLPVRSLPGRCGRCFQKSEDVPDYAEEVWLTDMSQGTKACCLAAQTVVPFNEKLELACARAIPSLSSLSEVFCCWSSWDRWWPSLPKLLSKAELGEHTGTWPSPRESSWPAASGSGSSSLPKLQKVEGMQPDRLYH